MGWVGEWEWPLGKNVDLGEKIKIGEGKKGESCIRNGEKALIFFGYKL